MNCFRGGVGAMQQVSVKILTPNLVMLKLVTKGFVKGKYLFREIYLSEISKDGPTDHGQTDKGDY